MNMRAGVGQRHSPPQAARVGCPCTAGEEPRDHRLPARGQVPHRHPHALPRRPRPEDARGVHAQWQLRPGDGGRTRCASHPPAPQRRLAHEGDPQGQLQRGTDLRADPHRGQPSVARVPAHRPPGHGPPHAPPPGPPRAAAPRERALRVRGHRGQPVSPRARQRSSDQSSSLCREQAAATVDGSPPSPR